MDIRHCCRIDGIDGFRLPAPGDGNRLGDQAEELLDRLGRGGGRGGIGRGGNGEAAVGLLRAG